MEAKAVLKYSRVTPRKARRVINLIKGKNASDALIALRYMPYRAASLVAKVLLSAIANATQKDNGADMDRLKIKTAFVDQGPVMKRMEPRAMGRANVIKKRSCHITIVVSEE